MPDPALIAGTALGALPVGYLLIATGGYAWQAGRHLADRLHGRTPTGSQQLADQRRAWDLDNPPPVEPAGHPLDTQVVGDLPARPVWDDNGDLIRTGDTTAEYRVVTTPDPDTPTDTLTGLPLPVVDEPTSEYVGQHRPPADDDRPTARIPRYVGHRHPIPAQATR